MLVKRLLCAVLVLLLLPACSNTDSPNQVGGKIIGGATGALIGAHVGKGKGQLAAVAIGTLLGAHLGGVVGEKMDAKDRQLANNSTYRALEESPDNTAVSWKNPNTQHSGSVTVVKTQEYGNNKVCRDYVHTVVIDGKEEKLYGRACRDVRDVRGQWVPAEG